LIECPRVHDIRGMVLERHHHDVMNLEIVGRVGGLSVTGSSSSTQSPIYSIPASAR
jgi:hypothetical protein